MFTLHHGAIQNLDDAQHSIKDDVNPEGDIEVKITGLRPGEKLYEELLIGNDPQKTNHSKIKKTSEPFIPFDQLVLKLNELKILLDNEKVYEVKNLLEELLNSYVSNTEIVDHIFTEQLAGNKRK